MTLKTNSELLIRILDTYTSGQTASLARIAEICGVSFSSIYQWMKDPEILVDYMGQTQISFAAAMQMARSVSRAMIVSQSLENFVLQGRTTAIVHHGEFSYVDDEAAIAATDEEFKLGLDLGYFFPDKKKRDQNGCRIVATRVELCPAQLIEKFAASAIPSVYGQRSELTVKGNVSLGVQTVGGPRRPIPAEFVQYATPRDLALDGVVETTLLTDDSGGEVYEADSLDDLLGLDDDEPDMAVTDTAPDEPEPEAVLRNAQPEPVMIVSAPTERETSPPPSPILATPKTVPAGWRAEYQALQEKLAGRR